MTLLHVVDQTAAITDVGEAGLHRSAYAAEARPDAVGVTVELQQAPEPRHVALDQHPGPVPALLEEQAVGETLAIGGAAFHVKPIGLTEQKPVHNDRLAALGVVNEFGIL